MHDTPATDMFEDVTPGKRLSASNQNKLHAAVRAMQQGRPTLLSVVFELQRVQPADVSNATPARDDGVIGTGIVNEGTCTIHSIQSDETSPGVFVRKIKELSADMQRKFTNAGQKFFSRDEVFAGASIGGSFIPFKLAGAEKIIFKTSTTIAAATYATNEITPGFATVDIYDWNADGTKLVKTNKTARVANMADAIVASGVFGQAFMLGKNYVVDWELCS